MSDEKIIKSFLCWLFGHRWKYVKTRICRLAEQDGVINEPDSRICERCARREDSSNSYVRTRDMKHGALIKVWTKFPSL